MIEQNTAENFGAGIEHPPKTDALKELILSESSTYVSKLWADTQSATGPFRTRLGNYYRQYRGIPGRKNYEGLANVVVNETLEACESITAQELHTIFGEPKPVMVQGREQTDQTKAILVENLMEYYFDMMGWKSKVLRQLRQKNKYGTTIARVCWCFQEKDITQRTKAGLSQSRRITKNHPDVEYLDLMDVAFDPGKPDIDDMDWVVVRKRVTWDYIKERERNGLYSPAQVLKIKRNSSAKKSSTIGDKKKQNLQAIGINYHYFDDNLYEILEYWGLAPRWWVDDEFDINSEQANEMVECVLEVVNDGETLRLERNPYWHQEKPFAIAQFIQVDDESYGMGVCEIAEYLQQELNDKRNQLLDHATEQIAPPLIINRAAAIDDTQIKLKPFQKIKSDLPGDSAITPMRLGGNPLENVTMDNIIKQDIRNQTGATNPVQGVETKKDQTAFEISTLQNRGSARINISTIDFSEKFLKRCYRLMFAMVQQYVDRAMVVRIVGKDGIKWEQVTPEDVACDYDIIPKVSTDMDNRSIVRNQLIQFLAQIVPIYPRINVYKLIKKIYMLFGFEDADEVIVPPPEEMGQDSLSMEQELQVLMMGQKIDVKYYDDHLNKLNFLMKFSSQFGNQLPPKAQAAIQDTISQHMNYLKVLEQAALAASSAGQPGASTVQPQGGSPAQPQQVRKTQNQTPVSLNAQGSRDMTRIGG